MFLYTMTVVTGKFEIVKESIVHISFDRRLQCVLIAFSFGAIIEGTSGFGTPVAIAGAVMVGLGFKPFQSAVLNLLANTAPVAWGAIGTPIVTLAAVSGLDQLTLSSMAGHQLPFVSILVPFWLVATFVKMEGGTWKEVFEVWPATLCAGGSFALMQWFASGPSRAAPDDRRGVGRVLGDLHRAVPALRLAPEDPLPAAQRTRGAGQAGKSTATATTDSSEWKYKYTAGETVHAWMPWVILIACCALWGVPEFKTFLNNLFASVKFSTTLLGSPFGGTLSLPVWDMPALHNLVQRMPPVAPVNAKPEAARFTINWLSAAGTGVFVAAILSGLVLKLNATQWKDAFMQTMNRMKIPVLVIGQVLGLGFLTRYSGTDAVLGPGLHRRRRPVPVLRRLPGLAGRVPDRLRHGLQRAVRQPAAHHGAAAAPERDPDRGHQLHRRRDGQDDRRAVDHGGVRRLLRRSEGARASRWDRSSARCSGTRSPAPP